MNDSRYIADNVFRYKLNEPLERIQTPARVFEMSNGKEMVVNAIWDTGSTFSSVSQRVVRQLEIPSCGKAATLGVAGTIENSVSLCFAFPGNMKYAAMVEANNLPDIPGTPDFIIGLDIISMGEFRLARENGQLMLTFIFDKKVFINFDRDSTEEAVRKMQAFNERMKAVWRTHRG